MKQKCLYCSFEGTGLFTTANKWVLKFVTVGLMTKFAMSGKSQPQRDTQMLNFCWMCLILVLLEKAGQIMYVLAIFVVITRV